MPKKSNFITDSEVPDGHFFDTFGNGVNRKISKQNLFAQIEAQAQTYYYDSEDDLKAANLEADPDNPIYVRVAPAWRLYRITSLAPVAPYDIALNNGATATLDRLENLQFINVQDMKDAPYLKIGDFVEFIGYNTPGDGGGNECEIGTGFGTADNGSVFDLPGSGLQAKGLFPNGLNWRQFGAIGDGAATDTAAIQAAHDYGFFAQMPVYAPAGDYLASGIKCYGILSDDLTGTELFNQATVVNFAPNAKLIGDGVSPFVIRSAESPSIEIPTNEVIYGKINNPIIDVGASKCGILQECCHYWEITSPDIRNIPAGTFSYDDGHVSGAQTYPCSGIITKGITGVAGAYHNEIKQPFIRGADGTKGAAGLFYCATLGQNNQRANFNVVTQGSIANMEDCINVEQGFNQKFDMVNTYDATRCYRINTGRNLIIKPYMELASVGIEFTSNTKYNVVISTSSVASTTTPYLDNGFDNLFFPENNLPRNGKIDANGGIADQSIPGNTWTKIEFDRSVVDDSGAGGFVDVGNSRLQIDSNGDGEGYYLVTGTVRFAVADGNRYEVSIYKNGSQIFPYSSIIPGASGIINIQVVSDVYMEKDDYVEVYVRHNQGGSATVTSSALTSLQASKQNYKINKPFNR